MKFLKMYSIIERALNFNFIFKLISRFVCLLGLIYHTTLLITQYCQGETTANILIKRNVNNILPAITICYPYALSFKKISELDTKYEKLYRIYLDHMKDYDPEENKSSNLLDAIRFIYENASDDVLSRISLKEFDLAQILKEYTIDLFDKHGEMLITIMINEEPTESCPDGHKAKWQEYIGAPVESFIIPPNFRMKYPVLKCFTFFSALQARWRNIELLIDLIHIRIKYDNYSIPYGKDKTNYLSIHSPNTLPETTNEYFRPYNFKTKYIIVYGQIMTKLLGSDYNTDCFDYNLDYKYANFNMRSDCIIWCYQNFHNKLYQANSYYPTYQLIRKEALGQLSNKTIVVSPEKTSTITAEAMSFCLDKCHKDCSFTYYSIGVDVYKESKDLEIYMSHNNLPDVFIEYLPKITFLTLVCDFGGLLGMWLGISILVIMEDSKVFLQKLFKRKTVNNINYSIYYKPNIISPCNKIDTELNSIQRINSLPQIKI